MVTGPASSGALRPAGTSGPRPCPACGRRLALNPDGSWPLHLNASSTSPCRGAGGHRAPADSTPSAITDPEARAETPRRGGEDRPSYLERRESRFRERALLDLEDAPAAEDLDDTLYRARESRGGLPTLGRGRR